MLNKTIHYFHCYFAMAPRVIRVHFFRWLGEWKMPEKRRIKLLSKDFPSVQKLLKMSINWALKVHWDTLHLEMKYRIFPGSIFPGAFYLGAEGSFWLISKESYLCFLSSSFCVLYHKCILLGWSFAKHYWSWQINVLEYNKSKWDE